LESSKKNISDKNKNDVTSELNRAEMEAASAVLEELEPEVGEIFDRLDPDKKRVVSRMFQYSGPVPPPELLRGYAEVYPDAPEKIFSLAENQQKHRQELEKEGLKKSYKYQLTGLTFGFLIALVLIVGALVLILMDKEILGISLLGPTFIGLVTLFVSQNRKDNSTKKRNENEDEFEED
jgi:uncharacterized membrane protein